MKKLNLTTQVVIFTLLVSVNSSVVYSDIPTLQNNNKYISSSSEDEERTGKGAFIHYDKKGNIDYVYEGDLTKGVPDGYGKMSFVNGFIYKSHFLGGKIDGEGEGSHPDGSKFKSYSANNGKDVIIESFLSNGGYTLKGNLTNGSNLEIEITTKDGKYCKSSSTSKKVLEEKRLNLTCKDGDINYEEEVPLYIDMEELANDIEESLQIYNIITDDNY